ncbi:K02A2.6-like [Cordylochernes scorpioides]|uniref:K02A2.6-like n=1 Tax=Cordylochernes scorpioides TaxID=51811 RepID=A0ABY6LV59_9ARAC|nr:K02A2.6-like [Cordylochernes scorpioides]
MQNINPPEQFNFNNPNEWPNWIKRFERFRKASELKLKKEEEQHFIGKRNVIFERAQFNRRYQQDGEAVEEYIRVLHEMAENCNNGSLKEEMIRDRIVVGVKNLQLSEKLQLEPNLTLERAIQAACQTECVKLKQTILRSTTTQAANVDQVYEKRLPPRRLNSTFGKRDASKKSKFQKWSKPEKSGCIRCGASKFHPYKDCPAKEVKCHKCKKVVQFAKVCYNKTVGQVTQGDDYHFVGNIYEIGQNSNDWKSIEKRNSLNPFEEYPKLFTGLGTLQGSYTIKLKDESQPHAIYTPKRIPIPLLNRTKEQLDQMVEKGVIEKLSNQRIDLTALKRFVKREHYPIPSVEYTLAQMGGAKLFSRLDANSGVWQIPLSVESSSLTTFLTPLGRYRFKRVPFGISSAPEVFQRKMSNLLESQSGVNCHMDDIVIWGATQEHDERLRCVLRKLQNSGLALNKEKCIFSVKEITFLGHLITERGVLPDPDKVQAIREFPSPSSISEVRRFLGMVNFTGKFIPDLSTILYPFNQLLVKRNDWRWDSAQEEAFGKITSYPPFKDENMKEIWQYQNEERVCREIKDYCEKGWPTKNELSAEAKAFWFLRYEMSVIDGLLMRNSRIYIPKSLRSKVLNNLHEGHLGIEKCRSQRSISQQPLIVSEFPSRAWEKVGIEHFYLKGKYYLLIADYYYRFPELALLEDQTTYSTIKHCKSIFARHGIPEEVRSDNRPQFGLEFKRFAKEYGFHHITSSPRFLQSNDFIESMVKNIKNKLKKGRDQYISLLGYRTAPLENGYSPSELCMNRKLRTTVPTSPKKVDRIRHRVDRMNEDEKEAREQEIGEFPNNDHGPTTPPPHLGTIIFQLATILARLQPLHPQNLDLTAFNAFPLPSPAITSYAQSQQSPEVFNSSRNHPFQDESRTEWMNITETLEIMNPSPLSYNILDKRDILLTHPNHKHITLISTANLKD